MKAEAKIEARVFQERFEDDVQFIFSHVQHHWHIRLERKHGSYEILQAIWQTQSWSLL